MSALSTIFVRGQRGEGGAGSHRGDPARAPAARPSPGRCRVRSRGPGSADGGGPSSVGNAKTRSGWPEAAAVVVVDARVERGAPGAVEREAVAHARGVRRG